MDLPLNCFKCDKELKPVFDDPRMKSPDVPYAGTTFITHGHYGSTVFDPIASFHSLMINICDQCMVEFKNRIALRRIIQREPTINFYPWDPTTYSE